MGLQTNNRTATVTINVANTNLNGTGSITTLFSSPSGGYGSILDRIRIQAISDNDIGMVRIFMRKASTSWALLKECQIPANTRSAQYTAFAQSLQLNLSLESGWEIGVSTEKEETFVVHAIGMDITGFI